MKLLINGIPHVFSAPMTLALLLDRQGYESTRVAVAVNRAFVPRSTWDTHTLQSGDEIEIVSPMQGG
jgi:sulfur carrier protein